MFINIITSIIAVAISSAILAITWMISKQTINDREKSSPFECGFDPMGYARSPLSMRFFLLAVIFLIFDVEIVLLIPAVSFSYFSMNPLTMFGIISFLMILIIGLFHEWNEGSLDWFI
uniref:NADH dehydrogenase subunit 3 n=1 Tax=Cocculina enigmadonta TaxID=2729702 RepID=UPI0021FFF5A6|nr:NADH dehydrogenase subunit 3 [Cocculina enigmadonta]UXN84358.1 NADH dehydrogenase subunit 3 [Cocculina enigmadonta]